MGAPSKRARKVRQADEFDMRTIGQALAPPKLSPSAYSWDLPGIVAARNDQMRGNFRMPARLAESMRTDDAIHVARENRLAPQRCIRVVLESAKGTRGASVAGEAEALFGQTGVGVRPDTMRDIHACLIDHSIAFAVNDLVPRPDGSRVDFFLRYWPIEWVRWDAIRRAYVTQTEGGVEEVITHGDGRWVVFQDGEHEPFKNAAILASSMVWARHAFAVRDWAKSSVAHGSAKVIGEMPEGIALQTASADGSQRLTPEAAAMVELLRAIASSDAPVGIRPAGAKTDFLTNTSSAWQIFAELVGNAERSAARIYLGTDGVLGTNGGAPGVDISQLFGVATTKIQADLACIERAMQTGVIEPWCATNFGSSVLAPFRRYMIADPDADAARESATKRRSAFFAAVKEARAAGFVVDQAFADALARQLGVVAPTLKEVTP